VIKSKKDTIENSIIKENPFQKHV